MIKSNFSKVVMQLGAVKSLQLLQLLQLLIYNETRKFRR